MFRLTRAQFQPIGLDIGHDSVKMLQLERVDNSLSIFAAARQPLPPEVKGRPELRTAAIVDVIRQMLKQGGFKGRSVVAALPREIVHVKNLRLPQMPVNELEQVVGFEARNVLPFDTAKARVHFLPAGEVRQGAEVRQEVIILAAKNEEIDAFLEILHGCGTSVESLDIEPCAIYRSMERFIRRREDEQEVNVIVDVGAMRSQVVIGKGRDISFIKPIDIGGRHFHEAVSRKLAISVDEAQALRRRLMDPADGADPAMGGRDPVRQAATDATRSIMEELGREISLCLRYYSVTFRGHRPTRMRLIGGEAGDQQLQNLLKAAITIPVEVAKPLYSIDSRRMKPGDRRGSMAEWTLALGLGLKLVHGTFGARDGKPRDPNAPREDLPAAAAQTPAVEVIDIPSALKAAGAMPPAGSPAAPATVTAAVATTGAAVAVVAAVAASSQPNASLGTRDAIAASVITAAATTVNSELQRSLEGLGAETARIAAMADEATSATAMPPVQSDATVTTDVTDPAQHATQEAAHA